MTVDACGDGSAVPDETIRTDRGFFGPNDRVIGEHELREAIRAATIAERITWLADDGSLLKESTDSQFGHLVKYWLARESRILPSTLPVVQARAVAQPPETFGRLLAAAPSDAQLAAAAAAARDVMLIGAPDTDRPPDLGALVEQALRSARQSRIDAEDDGPWSAVFVVSCIRGVGIELGLERLASGEHIGRDTLLAATDEHREYTLAAYRARFGPNPYDGAYQAFRVDEREPQIGDIVVQDRRAGIEPDDVVAFDEIPTRFTRSFPTHGDIVVEVSVSQRFVVTIGGNVGDSVRRRRYPLDGNGRLVVRRTEHYTQEDDSASLPDLPVVDKGVGLPGRSTRRIFALLSPVAARVVESIR